MSNVAFTLAVAGDVSSFTSSVRLEIEAAVAESAGVDPSMVEVSVSSGSVLLSVNIMTPTATAGTVQASMASTLTSPTAATAMLATVTSVPISVSAITTAPAVVALSPPPSVSPVSLAQTTTSTSTDMEMIAFVVGGCVAALFLVVAARFALTSGYCWLASDVVAKAERPNQEIAFDRTLTATSAAAPLQAA